ncbi:MAG: aconitate hydratase, partial [Phycisphaerales bacterium]
MTTTNDRYGARTALETAYGTKHFYRLDALSKFGDFRKLPISIRVLLESCLRNHDDFIVTEEHLRALMSYDAKNVGENEIPFMPGRVVLQDFTGVPCVVDLAAMRAAMKRLGGDPK